MIEIATQTLENLPIILFETADEWEAWLVENEANAPGVWLRLTKKASGKPSVTYAEALDVALCYGWIDGKKKSYDDISWVQKFTQRRSKSIWSKINRGKVEQLIENGRMRPAGLQAVEQAKQDGRWAAAYDSQSQIEVPEDFQAALDNNLAAQTFFATLKSANRYAILFRIHTAKKPETRARRIQQFIEMLEAGKVV